MRRGIDRFFRINKQRATKRADDVARVDGSGGFTFVGLCGERVTVFLPDDFKERDQSYGQKNSTRQA
jgi:hypothetical protein